MAEGSVFLLWHVRELDGNEEELLIGVYRTEADAKSAIERVRSKAGFVDAQEGFRINRYELNRDHWEAGYDVVTDSEKNVNSLAIGTRQRAVALGLPWQIGCARRRSASLSSGGGSGRFPSL